MMVISDRILVIVAMILYRFLAPPHPCYRCVFVSLYFFDNFAMRIRQKK